MKKWYFRLCLIVLISVSSCFADLQSYVEKSDSTYQYEVVQEQQLGSANVSVIQLTSLTWENKPWQHWLYLLKPKQILHPGKAVLVIVGGAPIDQVFPSFPKKR